jgi:hypothetical protein
VDVPVHEGILNLVTTLSERVQQLESKLDYIESRKRPAANSQNYGEIIPSLTEHHRLTNQAGVHQIDVSRALRVTQNSEPEAKNDSVSGPNGSDAEAEDAATVLEFLA